jgi:hypothetical protein
MAPDQDHERMRLALAAAVTELIRRRLLVRLAAITAAAVIALAVVLRFL